MFTWDTMSCSSMWLSNFSWSFSVGCNRWKKQSPKQSTCYRPHPQSVCSLLPAYRHEMSEEVCMKSIWANASCLVYTFCEWMRPTCHPDVAQQWEINIKWNEYGGYRLGPTSCVMLATWAMLYSVSSVDSFSMTKLEATMPRCHKGTMSGSMWP